MMLTIFLYSLTVVIVVFSYFIVVKPFLRIRKLQKQFTQNGYKVYVEKMNFFSNSLMQSINYDQKNHKDALYKFKTQYSQYDIILWNVYSNVMVFILSQNLLKQMFQKVQKFTHIDVVRDNLSRVFGGGLIMNQGKQSRMKRKFYSEMFNYKFLQQLHPVIQAHFEKSLGKLANKKHIDVATQLKEAFFNNFVMCYFGKQFQFYKYKDQNFSQSLINVFKQLLSQAYTIRFYLLGKRIAQKGYFADDLQIEKRLQSLLHQSKQFIQERFKQILQNKNLQNKHNNILAKLAMKDLILNLNGQQREKMMEDIIGDFILFFFAETDAMSATLTATLHILNKKPQIRDKLIEQINIKNLNYTPSNVKNWKYMDGVMNETLRLYGPGNWLFSRTVLEKNVTIGEVNISQDLPILIQTQTIHCNPKHYKDPLEFIPQRWFQARNQNSYTFISFGSGKRNCIGQYLARIQYKIALAKILQKYEMEPSEQFVMQIPFNYASKNNKFTVKCANHTKGI